MLHLVPEAKADLQEIWRYTVSQWEETQAERYIAELKRACDLLVASPLLGKALPEVGKGVCVYRCRHHYIFYLEQQKRVTFLAFVHERRDVLRRVITRLS